MTISVGVHDSVICTRNIYILTSATALVNTIFASAYHIMYIYKLEVHNCTSFLSFQQQKVGQKK